MKVESIDINQAKEELKKCPKVVRDYVKDLELRVENKQRLLDSAISKLKQNKP